MKEKEELIKQLAVTETIRQVQKLSELGEREFARIFYGIKDSNYNRDYVRSKFIYYQQEGFCRAYNRLDINNASRIIDYIIGEV
jgi:hypothetical protein